MLTEAFIGDRQQKNSNDPQERELRETEAHQLIHDLIGRNVEYFSSPKNRLDFMKGTDADGFFRIAQHVNAKLRGEKSWELRQRVSEEDGGFMRGRHAPIPKDKPEAFRRGYEAIQEYLVSSTDNTEKKIEGVAMAAEALVVWVHPFIDGNGRTSRFLGKFIENGADSLDDLVAETVSRRARNTIYSDQLETRERVIEVANNTEVLFSDESERDVLRARAETLPNDIEAMYLNIKRLLESDELRARTKRYQRKEPLAA